MSVAAAGAVAACRGLSPGPGEPQKPGTPLANGGADAGVSPILADERPTGRLVAFRDEEEMRAFEDDWKERATGKAKTRTYFQMPGPKDGDAGPSPAASVAVPKTPSFSPPPPPSPKPAAAPAPAATSAARGPGATDAPRQKAEASRDSKGGDKESITNNQNAQVDEGDIVKLHGDHLVVLRRGRLFTISLKDEKPRLSRMHDAFGPDIDPRGTWYDEMVVEDDHVVVVGFSYERGGTEIGLFRIDAAGNLAYRATYHLKSNDYYSARNYASRIVDGRLVFYAPLYFSPHDTTLANHFPAVRRWKRNAQEVDFVKTLNVKQLYHVEGEVPQTAYASLHTVTSCDLRTKELACESVGVIGPPGRVFYVSPNAVYVWMQDFAHQADKGTKDGELPSGMLARLPITRSKGGVTAIRVAGMPTDQFSFEEEDDGHLSVLVRSESNGDAMFLSEKTSGGNALVRLPKELFGDDLRVASPSRYRAMPRPDGYSVQNRFVGPWLLFGAGNGYVTDHHGAGQLYAVRYASNDEPVTVNIDQAVDRIEPMGGDAVIVGARGSDLVFTPIELGDRDVHARRDFVRKNASQGELRSHGFFYKPESGKKREGMIGLPIRSEGTRGARYLVEGSASVLFLQNRSLEFSELGALEAAPLRTNHDGCRASCVDWYGNARPIFAKGRIFALMGYELVEGRLETRGKTPRMAERGRLLFAPVGGPPVDEMD